MYTSAEFQGLCKHLIRNYVNDRLDVTNNKQISTDDVYLVWYCKALKNHKALLSTTLPDGMYYECTYNGDKEELYIDAYKKWENQCISLKKEKEEE